MHYNLYNLNKKQNTVSSLDIKDIVVEEIFDITERKIDQSRS